MLFSIVLALSASGGLPAPPLLWKDIRAGMSYADVQVLYPAIKGKVHHRKSWIAIEGVAEVGSCRPEVQVYFNRAGAVASVWLSSRQRGFPATSCAEEAESGLLAKYGKPTMRATDDDTYVWRRDNLLVRFRRSSSSDESWRIIYEVPATSDL